MAARGRRERAYVTANRARRERRRWRGRVGVGGWGGEDSKHKLVTYRDAREAAQMRRRCAFERTSTTRRFHVSASEEAGGGG